MGNNNYNEIKNRRRFCKVRIAILYAKMNSDYHEYNIIIFLPKYKAH